MSEILARIRVRETHGIRRFLYPLRVELSLPGALWAAIPQMRLVSSNDLPVPSQVSENPVASDPKRRYLDFALSLDPFFEGTYTLQVSGQDAPFDDPLQLSKHSNQGVVQSMLQSQQKRFFVSLDLFSFPKRIVYDSNAYLDDQGKQYGVQCNGEKPRIRTYKVDDRFSGSLYRSDMKAWLNGFIRMPLIYSDGRKAWTQADLTACKSWVTLTHCIEASSPQDEIVFTLPLAITSPTLTCDFGVGGYVFGKLDSKATEIVWHTEFGDAPYAKWTVATAGRVDYVGEVESAEAFVSQRWFHLIDSDKALAVAITKLPESCQSMTVRLTIEGNISIAFKPGGSPETVAVFGICYHFLNDVPAIAAATNPQSILLPPTVEVLPVG